MDKKIQEYIETKKKELEQIRNDKKQTAKNAFLIEQGFYEKVYAPEQYGVNKQEFPYSEYNQEKEAYLYYKLVPYDISDECYDEMLSAYNAVEDELENDDDDEENISKNNMAIFMTVVAVTIYIVGLVVGIVLGNNLGGYWFSWTSASICWFVGFVYGSLFLGVSEIIKLLNKNINQ